MTEAKAKIRTLRQQMRAKAEDELNTLINEAYDAVDKVTADFPISTKDLMKLCGGGEHKTLRHQLITKMANQLEQNLVKFWNDQQDLPLEGKSDGDK